MRTPTIVNQHHNVFETLAGFFSGGGAFGGPGPARKIDSCILWGNTANSPLSQQTQFDTSSGGTSNINNSCIQNLTFTPLNDFNIGDDPLFVNPLPASTAPFAGGDFHVESCSPVINAGNNFSLNGSGISQDLSGLPRIQSTIDIGCYEFQTAPSAPLRVTLQPVSFTNCSSASDAFQVAASGSGLSYQWEADFHDGNGFETVIHDNAHFRSEAATASRVAFGLIPPLRLNQSQYRCLITSSSGCSVHLAGCHIDGQSPAPLCQCIRV